MVTPYTLYWTREARKDLKQIFDYIANAESRQRALYVVEGIRAKAKETLNFPARYARDSYVDRDTVRFTLKWSYKIVYEIKENTIRILSIFHTAQNPEKLYAL